MRTIMLTLSSLAFLAWAVCATYSGVMFDLRCGNYLERAAKANTVELAQENLRVVVDYARTNGLTSGNSGALWPTPNQDVGFWYQNMTASLAELEAIPENATPLERSNVLMKLRETLLNNGENGDSIAVPGGISVFPHNALFFWWAWVSGVLALVFGGWRLLIALD